MFVQEGVQINDKHEPSPGYAGVSLSLAKTELNASLDAKNY